MGNEVSVSFETVGTEANGEAAQDTAPASSQLLQHVMTTLLMAGSRHSPASAEAQEEPSQEDDAAIVEEDQAHEVDTVEPRSWHMHRSRPLAVTPAATHSHNGISLLHMYNNCKERLSALVAAFGVTPAATTSEGRAAAPSAAVLDTWLEATATPWDAPAAFACVVFQLLEVEAPLPWTVAMLQHPRLTPLAAWRAAACIDTLLTREPLPSTARSRWNAWMACMGPQPPRAVGNEPVPQAFLQLLWEGAPRMRPKRWQGQTLVVEWGITPLPGQSRGTAQEPPAAGMWALTLRNSAGLLAAAMLRPGAPWCGHAVAGFTVRDVGLLQAAFAVYFDSLFQGVGDPEVEAHAAYATLLEDARPHAIAAAFLALLRAPFHHWNDTTQGVLPWSPSPSSTPQPQQQLQEQEETLVNLAGRSPLRQETPALVGRSSSKARGLATLLQLVGTALNEALRLSVTAQPRGPPPTSDDGRGAEMSQEAAEMKEWSLPLCDALLDALPSHAAAQWLQRELPLVATCRLSAFLRMSITEILRVLRAPCPPAKGALLLASVLQHRLAACAPLAFSLANLSLAWKSPWLWRGAHAVRPVEWEALATVAMEACATPQERNGLLRFLLECGSSCCLLRRLATEVEWVELQDEVLHTPRKLAWLLVTTLVPAMEAAAAMLPRKQDDEREEGHSQGACAEAAVARVHHALKELQGFLPALPPLAVANFAAGVFILHGVRWQGGRPPYVTAEERKGEEGDGQHQDAHPVTMLHASARVARHEVMQRAATMWGVVRAAIQRLAAEQEVHEKAAPATTTVLCATADGREEPVTGAATDAAAIDDYVHEGAALKDVLSCIQPATGSSNHVLRLQCTENVMTAVTLAARLAWEAGSVPGLPAGVATYQPGSSAHAAFTHALLRSWSQPRGLPYVPSEVREAAQLLLLMVGGATAPANDPDAAKLTLDALVPPRGMATDGMARAIAAGPALYLAHEPDARGQDGSSMNARHGAMMTAALRLARNRPSVMGALVHRMQWPLPAWQALLQRLLECGGVSADTMLQALAAATMPLVLDAAHSDQPKDKPSDAPQDACGSATDVPEDETQGSGGTGDGALSSRALLPAGAWPDDGVSQCLPPPKAAFVGMLRRLLAACPRERALDDDSNTLKALVLGEVLLSQLPPDGAAWRATWPAVFQHLVLPAMDTVRTPVAAANLWMRLHQHLEKAAQMPQGLLQAPPSFPATADDPCRVWHIVPHPRDTEARRRLLACVSSITVSEASAQQALRVLLRIEEVRDVLQPFLHLRRASESSTESSTAEHAADAQWHVARLEEEDEGEEEAFPSLSARTDTLLLAGGSMSPRYTGAMNATLVPGPAAFMNRRRDTGAVLEGGSQEAESDADDRIMWPRQGSEGDATDAVPVTENALPLPRVPSEVRQQIMQAVRAMRREMANSHRRTASQDGLFHAAEAEAEDDETKDEAAELHETKEAAGEGEEPQQGTMVTMGGGPLAVTTEETIAPPVNHDDPSPLHILDALLHARAAAPRIQTHAGAPPGMDNMLPLQRFTPVSRMIRTPPSWRQPPMEATGQDQAWPLGQGRDRRPMEALHSACVVWLTRSTLSAPAALATASALLDSPRAPHLLPLLLELLRAVAASQDDVCHALQAAAAPGQGGAGSPTTPSTTDAPASGAVVVGAAASAAAATPLTQEALVLLLRVVPGKVLAAWQPAERLLAAALEVQSPALLRAAIRHVQNHDAAAWQALPRAVHSRLLMLAQLSEPPVPGDHPWPVHAAGGVVLEDGASLTVTWPHRQLAIAVQDIADIALPQWLALPAQQRPLLGYRNGRRQQQDGPLGALTQDAQDAFMQCRAYLLGLELPPPTQERKGPAAAATAGPAPASSCIEDVDVTAHDFPAGTAAHGLAHELTDPVWQRVMQDPVLVPFADAPRELGLVSRATLRDLQEHTEPGQPLLHPTQRRPLDMSGGVFTAAALQGAADALLQEARKARAAAALAAMQEAEVADAEEKHSCSPGDEKDAL